MDPAEPGFVHADQDHDEDSRQLPRILCITWAYNESDILPHMIRHTLAQGVDMLLFDNQSTDGTLDVLRSFAIMYPDRITIAQWPDAPTNVIRWDDLVHITEDTAYELRDKYDWFMHQDADELVISPAPGESVVDFIARMDADGYNAIDHEMNIMRSREGWNGLDNPDEFFNEFVDTIDEWRAENEREVKVWRTQPRKVDLAHNGGHTVRFPGRKIAPDRLLKFHYTMRGQAHADKKIASRRARFSAEEQAQGYHSHYDKYRGICLSPNCSVDSTD